jgi:dCMP deaminase
MNAIINASPEEMIDSSLYLCGVEVDSGEIVDNADCCAMCKRMIINARIKTVYIRMKEGVKIINVSDWIENDDSINGIMGY